MGMQRIGESDPSALHALVERWVEDATLLEQRATPARMPVARLVFVRDQVTVSEDADES